MSLIMFGRLEYSDRWRSCHSRGPVPKAKDSPGLLQREIQPYRLDVSSLDPRMLAS